MIIKFKNIGKISNAELKFDGITVLAGNNNTGKSTVGKALFGLYYALTNLEDNIEEQRLELSRDRMYDFLMSENHADNDTKYARHYLRVAARKIAEYFLSNGDDKDKIITELKRLGISDPEKLNKVYAELNAIYEVPEDRLIKRALNNVFQNIFNYHINNQKKKDEEASISAGIKGKEVTIKFEDNICSDIYRELRIIHDAVYIDDPFALDEVDNIVHGKNLMKRQLVNKIRQDEDEINDVVKQGYLEEKLSKVFEQMMTIDIGDVYRDESGEYVYKDSDGIYPVRSTSAGLKAFALIKCLLQKGELKEKDVLILDEPEIHLHPEWLLKYAEMIIVLQKNIDLTILINTHSQVFLDAIDYYSEKHSIKERCNYYFADLNEYGCDFMDVTDNLDIIYSQMVDPSIELNRLRYKLEEDKDE